MLQDNFWRHKSLAEMTSEEWEALCDGCGKCCLHKLLDEGDDEVSDNTPMSAQETLYYTDVRCRYLDPVTARCKCYSQRLSKVPDCVDITVEDLHRLHYMPASCAYRVLSEGKPLPEWHPLRHEGSRQPMEEAGMTITGYPTIADNTITSDDYENRIVTWPLAV